MPKPASIKKRRRAVKRARRLLKKLRKGVTTVEKMFPHLYSGVSPGRVEGPWVKALEKADALLDEEKKAKAATPKKPTSAE